MMTFMKSACSRSSIETRFASIRAMHCAAKVEQGFVAGGKGVRLRQLRIAKGQVERHDQRGRRQSSCATSTRASRPVRGAQHRRHLNRAGARARARSRGGRAAGRRRPIRAVLERPIYRGEVVYGRMAKSLRPRTRASKR